MVEYLTSSGYMNVTQQTDADYVDAGEISPNQIVSAILSSFDLQMQLTTNVPTFRNAFVNFLLDFISQDGVDDTQLSTAREILQTYVRVAFASSHHHCRKYQQ